MVKVGIVGSRGFSDLKRVKKYEKQFQLKLN